MSNERISDLLKYVTIQILTSKTESTNWTGSGTGFLFMFGEGDRSVPLLVTNKHVIDGAVTIGLTFHVTTDDNNSPVSGSGNQISIRLNHLPVIRHPNSDVDLAALPIASLMKYASEKEGWQPYIKCLNSSNLPSPRMISELGALEDVVMVGYPNGLADAANNFPIVRRGITSTPYASDYQEKRQFLADIPVFTGSSGLPIFIVNEGAYATGNKLIVGTRFALLGVLYAGHTQTINGSIVAAPVPTTLQPVARVEQMINLGLCIKSALIAELSNEIPEL